MVMLTTAPTRAAPPSPKPRPSEEDLIKVPYAVWAHQPPTASEAQEWFRKKHPKLVVPAEFNYDYLVSYSLAPINTAPFEGREVPQLLFVRSTPQSSDVLVKVYYEQPEPVRYLFTLKVVADK